MYTIANQCVNKLVNIWKKVVKNRKFAFVIFKYEDFSKERAKDKIN